MATEQQVYLAGRLYRIVQFFAEHRAVERHLPTSQWKDVLIPSMREEVEEYEALAGIRPLSSPTNTARTEP